jgi:hypothetical protein
MFKQPVPPEIYDFTKKVKDNIYWMSDTVIF